MIAGIIFDACYESLLHHIKEVGFDMFQYLLGILGTGWEQQECILWVCFALAINISLKSYALRS